MKQQMLNLESSHSNISLLAGILAKAVDFYELFIAMVLSDLLLGNVVFGGALCLMGQVWVVFARLYGKRAVGSIFSARFKSLGIAIFILAFLLNIALLIVYPSIARQKNFFLLAVLIALNLARQFILGITAYRLPLRAHWKNLILCGIHVPFGIVFFWLLAENIGRGDFHSLLLLMVGDILLSSLAHILVARIPTVSSSEPIAGGEYPDISSFKLYNKMTSYVLMAINISIIAQICYVRYDPAEAPLYGFLSLIAWLLFIAGMGGLFYLFLTRKKALTRFDKPSLFVLGALMWTVGSFISYHEFLPEGLIRILVTNALFGCGMAAMLSVIVSLGSDMKEVLELGIPPEQVHAYRRNTGIMVQWSLLLSSLLMLLMFTVSSFVLDGKMDQVEARLGMHSFMRTIMLLLPAVLVFAALLNALMQPLNKHYAEKLRLYRTQMAEGSPSPTLYEKLQSQLYKKRQRLSYRFIRLLLRPFMPCRVVGKELVNTSDEPVIFVCNHLEIYGPMVTNLHMPFYFRPWILFRMLDEGLIADNLQNGVDKVLYILPEKWRKKVAQWIAPLMLHIMESTDPIPVYRSSGRDVIKTIKLSVDAMVDQDNILLFPEDPEKSGDGAYLEKGASAFFTGFVAIAEQYYKRVKKRAVFYPVYVDKFQHTLTFGEGIAFNPENAKAAERHRIADELCTWMNERGNQD